MKIVHTTLVIATMLALSMLSIQASNAAGFRNCAKVTISALGTDSQRTLRTAKGGALRQIRNWQAKGYQPDGATETQICDGRQGGRLRCSYTILVCKIRPFNP
ncbi:MAG: hypothetical protein GY954_04220 [Alteromonas sp.]|nr:hypothetical protein [Alteromonas sp.]